jgi:hypothetical protein
MNKVGIKSIKVLDEKMHLGADAFKAYEKKYPPSLVQGVMVKPLEKFADVGVVRITLQILDETFRKISGSPNSSQYEEFGSLIIKK